MRHAPVVIVASAAVAAAILACVGNDPSSGSDPAPEAGPTGSGGESGTSGTSGTPGTSGTSGTPGSSGTSGTSGKPGADAAAAMLVFVTTGEFDGSLTGVTGADMYCQQAALNGALPGGATAGSYLAWLASDHTDEPAARFKKSASGYKHTDGVLVAATWNDLTSGMLLAPINMTEMKSPINANPYVFTNVDKGGIEFVSTKSCTSWTTQAGEAIYGDATKIDQRWTINVDFKPCSNVLHLYCFQQK